MRPYLRADLRRHGLRKLDELGPGDVVVIRDRDDQVTITAIAR